MVLSANQGIGHSALKREELQEHVANSCFRAVLCLHDTCQINALSEACIHLLYHDLLHTCRPSSFVTYIELHRILYVRVFLCGAENIPEQHSHHPHILKFLCTVYI